MSLLEEILDRVVEAIENLDFPARANIYGDTISVFVDTYEVNEDPMGAVDEIRNAVEYACDELEYDDCECHEMVCVDFVLAEEEDEEDEGEF